MSGCNFDALESLAAGELPPDLAAKARSHAAACPACARELALLRAERAAFAERARGSASPSLPLPGFAAALALSRWSGPETPAPKATPPAAKPPAKPSFPWAVSAFGVAAAAAFAGLFLVPPGAAPRIEIESEDEERADVTILAEPGSEALCHDEAFDTGITSAPKGPNACESPAYTVARATAAADTAERAACAPEPIEAIVTCGHDSCVTEACSSPLHN